MLKCINGRIVDVFKTEDGKKVDGEYFTHLFYSENSIKQFQIVQDKINHIIILLLIANYKLTIKIGGGLRRKWRLGTIFFSLFVIVLFC